MAKRAASVKPLNEKAVLEACNAISNVDDRLGAFADYEGNVDGPTWYFWQQGRAAFEAQCERAIRLHEESIAAWRKVRELNQGR